MQILTKFIPVILTLSLIVGCQDEGSEEPSAPMDQQGQMEQDQFQQPSADVNVSDEEVDQFIDAVTNAQEVQMDAQQRMIGIIEDEGMDVETYSQIAQSVQMGGAQAEGELDVSESDMETYEKISERIEDAQGEIEQEINEAVEESGMEMERFEEINAAVQQDQELQQRVRSKMQEMQPQQPMQQQQPPQQQQP